MEGYLTIHPNIKMDVLVIERNQDDSNFQIKCITHLDSTFFFLLCVLFLTSPYIVRLNRLSYILMLRSCVAQNMYYSTNMFL